jgi:ribosome-associated translation inhibitor RaiA
MMSNSADARQSLFHDNAIRVGVGFTAKEHSFVLDSLSALSPHLGRWDPRDVEVNVSLQDRGSPEQRVTVRVRVPGLSPLVAVAGNPDIARALNDAKRELTRQLEHQKAAHEPMNNRRLRRATIRHPSTPGGPDAQHLRRG